MAHAEASLGTKSVQQWRGPVEGTIQAAEWERKTPSPERAGNSECTEKPRTQYEKGREPIGKCAKVSITVTKGGQ